MATSRRAASLVGLFGLFHMWRCCACLLVINALLTANFPILNPALPLVYAYAVAYVAGGT